MINISGFSQAAGKKNGPFAIKKSDSFFQQPETRNPQLDNRGRKTNDREQIFGSGKNFELGRGNLKLEGFLFPTSRLGVGPMAPMGRRPHSEFFYILYALCSLLHALFARNS